MVLLVGPRPCGGLRWPCGETVLLAWLLGVSHGDTWLFLPDLVDVWDVGACVVRLWSHVVAPGCAKGCFRIVFDSAGSAGIMLGPTRVVGHDISLFRYFVALYRVRCRTVVVAACSLCISSSVSCERVSFVQCELRVAFLQVLEVYKVLVKVESTLVDRQVDSNSLPSKLLKKKSQTGRLQLTGRSTFKGCPASF
ncbi:hypothetical protein Taro_030210 [Colocasia esculenta]|uniref:Uncharacterized protein n=1 Tax=Colocasia esculenta TaxID=4460 RepID=A0A843VX76_COLES|nr:hypothetical protein [Colocasia esculenta]